MCDKFLPKYSMFVSGEVSFLTWNPIAFSAQFFMSRLFVMIAAVEKHNKQYFSELRRENDYTYW